MALSTQIIIKGLDFEALSEITGASHNQAIDEVTLGASVGVIIETLDVAGVPEVPDPSATYSGRSGAFLSKCKWKRVTATGIIYYSWDDNAVSVATYLKWISDNATADEALALATTADTNADTALNTAITAQGVAQAAQTTANSALTAANNAQTAADAAAASISGTGLIPTGFCVPVAFIPSYSLIANQGWLPCDGSEVAIVTFNNLYSVIGTTWGVTATPLVTFKLPDFRGRVIGGVGTGSGLSARTIGNNGLVGSETHELTPAEGPPHQHFLANGDEVVNPDAGDIVAADEYLAGEVDPGGEFRSRLGGTATVATRGLSSVAGGSGVDPEVGDAHNIMQPTAFCYWYIKT